jgi:hypothetical protein
MVIIRTIMSLIKLHKKKPVSLKFTLSSIETFRLALQQMSVAGYVCRIRIDTNGITSTNGTMYAWDKSSNTAESTRCKGTLLLTTVNNKNAASDSLDIPINIESHCLVQDDASGGENITGKEFFINPDYFLSNLDKLLNLKTFLESSMGWKFPYLTLRR